MNPKAELRLRLAGASGAERLQALLETVQLGVLKALAWDPDEEVPADLSFQELGFDSIAALEFAELLSVATGLDVRATALFDHPTPRAMAAHLRELMFGSAADDAADGARVDDDLREASADELLELVRRETAADGRGDSTDEGKG
jgi:acyl carrier protein